MPFVGTPHGDTERKTLMILRILRETGEPLGSRHLAREMRSRGIVTSERAVRYHLKLMDERGLTRLVGKKDGRVITERGVEEVVRARVRDKVGLAISRIEILSFRTTFDPRTGKGEVPVNVSLLPAEGFSAALEIMGPVFAAGYAVSPLVAVATEGERLGDVLVPEGMTALATVCSIVVNGVLLKSGIPMDSKFGGILQVRGHKPLRFVELITYAGSSLDPSEVFIRGGMTDVIGATQDGEGLILANFREIPAPCLGLMGEIVSALEERRIGGVLTVGEVSAHVCQVPVDINKAGIILVGGLNPVSALRERGWEVENRAMATVLDYERLRPVDGL